MASDWTQWLNDHGAEASATVVSVMALLLSLYVDARSRRWRREDLEKERTHFLAQNQPVLLVKPRFDLRPGDNRLVLEVSNLNSSIFVRNFSAACSSIVSLDGKSEHQSQTVAIDAIPPASTREIACGEFFCDLDSFVANVGEKTFVRTMPEIDRKKEIAKLRELGYLRHRQASIGHLRVEWTYAAAQPESEPVRGTADYPVEPWLYGERVFLSLSCLPPNHSTAPTG